MNITFSIKQLGRRKPTINQQVLDIPLNKSTCTLEEFLKAVVTQQVEAFNERQTSPQLIPFLTKEAIESKLVEGKVSFGEVYNSNTVEVDKAIENALLAYKDGLYKVFQNEEEIETLTQQIEIQAEDVFTFIRLSFLTGN